jgi:hypothetical protein
MVFQKKKRQELEARRRTELEAFQSEAKKIKARQEIVQEAIHEIASGTLDEEILRKVRDAINDIVREMDLSLAMETPETILSNIQEPQWRKDFRDYEKYIALIGQGKSIEPLEKYCPENKIIELLESINTYLENLSKPVQDTQTPKSNNPLTINISFITNDKDRNIIERLLREKDKISDIPIDNKFSVINQKGIVRVLIDEGLDKDHGYIFFGYYLTGYMPENIDTYYRQLKKYFPSEK